jgi:hypothetical protein
MSRTRHVTRKQLHGATRWEDVAPGTNPKPDMPHRTRAPSNLTKSRLLYFPSVSEAPSNEGNHWRPSGGRKSRRKENAELKVIGRRLDRRRRNREELMPPQGDRE